MPIRSSVLASPDELGWPINRLVDAGLSTFVGALPERLAGTLLPLRT
jgi:hypothetical protein